jgi:hypothetical protein
MEEPVQEEVLMEQNLPNHEQEEETNQENEEEKDLKKKHQKKIDGYVQDLTLIFHPGQSEPVLKSISIQCKPYVQELLEIIMQKSRKKRKIKDKDAPKKPRNAYIIFMHLKREDIKTQNPQLKTNSEVTKFLGTLWKSMSDEDKASYFATAKQEKETYEKEIEQYEIKKNNDSKQEGYTEPIDIKRKKKKRRVENENEDDDNDGNKPKKKKKTKSLEKEDGAEQVIKKKKKKVKKQAEEQEEAEDGGQDQELPKKRKMVASKPKKKKSQQQNDDVEEEDRTDDYDDIPALENETCENPSDIEN